MSYHSHMKWTWDDGISDELIDEIVKGLLANKSDMKGEKYTLTFYNIIGPIDMFISQIGGFLDEHPESETRTEEIITNFVKDAPKPELIKEILALVIEQLENSK